MQQTKKKNHKVERRLRKQKHEISEQKSKKSDRESQ